MASSTTSLARSLTRQATALDPVGCCLALEGRLSSAEGHDLSGALKQQAQASGELARTAASPEPGERLLNGLSPHASAGTPFGAPGHASPQPEPRCLTSSAARQHLPADFLSAFQAGSCAGELDQQQQQEQDQDHQRGGAGGSSSSSSSCAPARPQQLLRSGSSRGRSAPGAAPAEQPGRGGAPVSSGSAGGALSPGQRSPSLAIAAAIERAATATLDANGGVDHGAGVHDPTSTCPPYAVKSTCGKRAAMEDTYALCPNICELPMSPMSAEYADKLPPRVAAHFGDQPEQQQQQQPGAPADAPAAAEQQQQQQQQQQQLQQPGAAACSPSPPAQPTAAAEAPAQQAPPPPDPAAAAVFAGAAMLPASLAPPPSPQPPRQPSPDAASPEGEASMSSFSSGSDGGGSVVEKLHFFGVYDGHGGIEASQHCAERLHYHLSTGVAEMASSWLAEARGGGCSGGLGSAGGGAGGEAAPSAGAARAWNPEFKYVPVDTVRVSEGPADTSLAAAAGGEPGAAAAAASAGVGSPPAGAPGDAERDLGRCVSDASTGTSASSGAPAGSPGSPSGSGSGEEPDSGEGSEGGCGPATFCGMMELVLRDAFLKTDAEFSESGLQAGLVGSTAVVALVGTHRVWIANCGDSRAVLSRAGRAIQVTDDHKPEREDEAERVEKAGGQVLYWNGHRVMGVLAMSRAIGDHCLRPYVIPEPEITVFARHAADEILLLASDGLWDVLTNQEAADLALRCIKRARGKGASRKAAARVAATVLTKAAVDKGSRDNITVVIIDLAPPGAGECPHNAPQPPCAAQSEGDEAGVATAAGEEGQPDASSSSGSSGPASCSACAAGLDAGGSGAGGGSGSRSSRSGSRPGSGHSRSGGVGRSSSGGVSNPFAAAAASPFSTAATGSSELPLPAGTSAPAPGDASGAAAAAAVGVAAAVERSQRSSGPGSAQSSGRLRASGAGASGGSAFAAAAGALAAGSASGSGLPSSQPSGASSSTARASQLGSQLDSLDLSGLGAGGGVGSSAGGAAVRRSSAGGAGGAAAARRSGAGSSLPSIASMAAASSAAGSTTSSLEEQPTLVEPPPQLGRQASSSPFSAFTTSQPFD